MSKVIVITGGSDGIGKAIAKSLSGNNKVIIISRNRGKLSTLASEIKCEYKVCDVSQPVQVKKTFEEIIHEHKKIDVLINNAGLWIEGKLESNDVESIKSVIEVNTLGTIYCTHVVLASMKTFNEGFIINVNSQAGLNARAERSVYSASKFAVTAFTKSLQEELAGTGVRVTGLYPGRIKTDLFAKAGNDVDLSNALETEEILKTIEFLLSTKNATLIPEIGIRNN